MDQLRLDYDGNIDQYFQVETLDQALILLRIFVQGCPNRH